MNTDLRIPVTAEQKRLIGEAVADDPRGLAAWAREVLLSAAAEVTALPRPANVTESGQFFQVMVDSAPYTLPARLLQLTIKAPGGSDDDIKKTGFLATPDVSRASSVDVGAVPLARSTVGIVASGDMAGPETGSGAVTWCSFEKRCG